MTLPDFSFEQIYWKKGYVYVVGVDEVGRGALAGPVVAGAAALRRIRNDELGIRNIENIGIDDSKRLTPQRREMLAPFIRRYFYTAIGEASVVEINRLGIVKATRRAMRRAITRMMNHELRITNDNNSAFLLMDGFGLPYAKNIGIHRQTAIIRGDQKSISIAAASIVAKVYRDKLMRTLERFSPQYCCAQNKGYGTRVHREAIEKFGFTPFHRKAFVVG